MGMVGYVVHIMVPKSLLYWRFFLSSARLGPSLCQQHYAKPTHTYPTRAQQKPDHAHRHHHHRQQQQQRRKLAFANISPELPDLRQARGVLEHSGFVHPCAPNRRYAAAKKRRQKKRCDRIQGVPRFSNWVRAYVCMNEEKRSPALLVAVCSWAAYDDGQHKAGCLG